MRPALIAMLFLFAQGQQYQEKIVVERILIDVRVTDYKGNPVMGLKPEDFRVLIDDKKASVESVEWIPETAAARELADIDKPQPQLDKDSGEDTTDF